MTLLETPNYVLKTNEAVWMNKKIDKKYILVKTMKWLIVLMLGFFCLYAFVKIKNFWATIICWASFVNGFLSAAEPLQELVPSPLELQFYDEHFILYRPKRYFSKTETCREIDCMKYNEITKCVYNERSQKIQIYGAVNTTHVRFQSDGMLSSKEFNRKFHRASRSFSTKCATDIDFVSEIEANSPIKVTVRKERRHSHAA